MKIDGNTKIFGLFGYPLTHTASPRMQSAAFRALGVNAVYLPFLVLPENLSAALRAIVPLGISGINVTLPHKERIIPYLDKLSPDAKAVGAVNVVLVKGERLTGYNTDVEGFLTSLQQDLGITPRGKRFFVLGAGGASRAVVFGLAKKEAKEISLSDIKSGRAEKLARDIRKAFPRRVVTVIPPRRRRIAQKVEEANVFINATPVGMRRGDPSSLDARLLRRDLYIFDVVYNIPTRLVKLARRRGMKAVGGENMLLYQGAAAFRLWLGVRPPLAVMRRALRAFLKR